jgi:RimJ/RimL family protein N-acetyltransferase
MTKPRVTPWLAKLPELETERLRLRQWSLADLQAIVAMDCDPDVYRFLEKPGDPTKQRADTRGRILTDFGPGLGVWSIFPRDETANFLGYVLLSPLDDTGPDVELGFRLVSAAWGRGIATEASARLVRHGFETVELDEIIAVTDPDNEGSERTLKRLGFKREGWRYAWGYDNHFFRLTKRRWLVLTAPQAGHTPTHGPAAG